MTDHRSAMRRDEIAWAYRYLLGRDPSEQEASNLEVGQPCWSQLREQLLNCDEFAADQKVIGHTPKWVLTEVFGGRLAMWVDLADKYVSFGCLIDNYEPQETTAFRRLLQPGFHVVDVGANVGWFSFCAVLELAGSGRVTAIEPRHPTVDYLRRSVSFNRLEDRLCVVETAVGREISQSSIIWYPPSRNPGSAHLGTAGEGWSGQAVDVCPLDILLPDTPVDCIKMDIEGAEGLAILGAERILSTYRPFMLCEINPAGLHAVSAMSVDEFLLLVRSRSYVVFSLDEATRLVRTDGGIEFAGREIINVVLVHADRLASLQTI